MSSSPEAAQRERNRSTLAAFFAALRAPVDSWRWRAVEAYAETRHGADVLRSELATVLCDMSWYGRLGHVPDGEVPWREGLRFPLLDVSDGVNFDEARSTIEQLPAVETTESDRVSGALTAIPVNGSAAAWREVTDLVADKGWQASSVQLESGRLDEVFRTITQGAAT